MFINRSLYSKDNWIRQSRDIPPNNSMRRGFPADTLKPIVKISEPVLAAKHITN